MKIKTKEYSNEEITILWKADKCIHAGICVKTLPKVYNPNARPWIKPENATSKELKDQVANCPSGALSIKQQQNMIKVDREDDGKKGRFTIYENDEFAGEMTYTWAGETKFIIDHTGVEKQFGGKGFGKQLVLKAIDFARSNDVKIIPLCPYANKVMNSDKNFEDVLLK